MDNSVFSRTIYASYVRDLDYLFHVLPRVLVASSAQQNAEVTLELTSGLDASYQRGLEDISIPT